jgi:hypothetical protein
MVNKIKGGKKDVLLKRTAKGKAVEDFQFWYEPHPEDNNWLADIFNGRDRGSTVLSGLFQRAKVRAVNLVGAGKVFISNVRKK